MRGNRQLATFQPCKGAPQQLSLAPEQIGRESPARNFHWVRSGNWTRYALTWSQIPCPAWGQRPPI